MGRTVSEPAKRGNGNELGPSRAAEEQRGAERCGGFLRGSAALRETCRCFLGCGSCASESRGVKFKVGEKFSSSVGMRDRSVFSEKSRRARVAPPPDELAPLAGGRRGGLAPPPGGGCRALPPSPP